MFNVTADLLHWMQLPHTSEYGTVLTIGPILYYIFAASIGFGSGIMADRVERKQPIMAGLVLLGISYAVLGTLFHL
jgi:MFS family permease